MWGVKSERAILMFLCIAVAADDRSGTLVTDLICALPALELPRDVSEFQILLNSECMCNRLRVALSDLESNLCIRLGSSCIRP